MFQSYNLRCLAALYRTMVGIMSLARKYRPQKFRELVGQEPICRALLQCLRINDAPQAFLFSGIRGTGKTTLARLYATALCCESQKGFEECAQCTCCESGRLGHHEDIMEIDGASHNSVEDIRSLRESVLYIPKRSKYKIYIIDEVHMLSRSAFNALLKTLEEPPSHVIFLFATTEITKLPATIIGRCQSFHLKRITSSAIIQRMTEILQKESISFDKSALTPIVSQAEGSLRDALSLLDQSIALGCGKLTLEAVQELVAYVPIKQYFSLWGALLARRTEEIFAHLSLFYEKGLESQAILHGLALTTRNAFILNSLPEEAPEISKLELTSSEAQELRSLCHDSSSKKLHDLFHALSQGFQTFTASSLDRYILENLLLEWTAKGQQNHHDSKDTSISSVNTYLTANNSSQTSSFSTPQIPSPKQKKTHTSLHPKENTQTQHHLQQKTPKSQETTSQTQSKNNTSITTQDQVAATASSSTTGHAAIRPTTAIQSKQQIQIPPHTESADNLDFPNSWSELLDIWNKSNPIMASEMAFCRVVEFSPKKIILMVDSKTSEGASLLQQKKLMTSHLKKIFTFSGTIDIIPHYSSNDNKQTISYNDLPLSVAELHRLSEQKKRDQVLKNCKQSPLAKWISQEFPDSTMNVVWHNNH